MTRIATTVALMALMAGLMTVAGAEEAVKGWTKTADLSLNLNQTSYSNSWTGGENGAITWSMKGDLAAEKALSPKFNWRNTLKLAFGQTHQETKDAAGARHWESPAKSTDRIFFESLLRMTLGYHVDPYAAVTVESQFYDPADSTFNGARVMRVSRILNPITLTESFGVGRTLTKSKETEFLTRLGFAVRQHMMKNVVMFDPEETENENTMDGGLEWVTDFSHTFSGESMKYVSKLRVFQALFYSESDKLEGETKDDWKTADVAWENTFSANVSRYIQVSLFAEVLYDKEIDVRGRFRETLGLGVAYKLY